MYHRVNIVNIIPHTLFFMSLILCSDGCGECFLRGCRRAWTNPSRSVLSVLLVKSSTRVSRPLPFIPTYRYHDNAYICDKRQFQQGGKPIVCCLCIMCRQEKLVKRPLPVWKPKQYIWKSFAWQTVKPEDTSAWCQWTISVAKTLFLHLIQSRDYTLYL